ncbi:MAG TPA: preprotein translocase subunit SecY [Saprospiraceae bacterium]|nr:preprotein translocase subunit SecY [Saprospiraceae bacterium]
MNRLINTLKNIWKIEELRKRILVTLGLILVYRIGAFIVLPGVVASKISMGNPDNPGDIVQIINMFTGGAFKAASIFALGIMPYITASIVIQVLGFAVPYFQRLQTKEGESGRKKITQITRILTVFITLVQGSAYLTMISSKGAIDPNVSVSVFWFSNIIILMTGTIFAMWLGERITERGVGNGVSILILIGIISRLPQSFITEFTSKIGKNGGLVAFVLEMVFLFLVVLATVMITQAIRRIPIQFAKRMVGRGTSNMPVAGARDFIPIKLNASGVMPIIFAQALMMLPAMIGGFFSKSGTPNSFVMSLSDFTSVPYNVIYFVLIVLFTYVYTALIVDPKQYSEYLKQQNAFIPGVKPGRSTAEFIDTITSRITLPGAIFLGIIAIMPAFANIFGVNRAFAYFFGGTSLLILVGVALDTLQQIESYLLMRKYDGLIKSGKLQGRGSGLQGIGASM